MAEQQNLNSSTPILPIGALADTLGVHQRTLRIYDKEGILCPKRTDKNRRSYSLDDLEKAKVILFLTRNLALNLAGVKVILTILEKNNVEPKDYLNYIQNIAKDSAIDMVIQECNKEKYAKKGRKAKN